MAVTIDEMHVEVKEAAPGAGSAASAQEPAKKEVDLRSALEMLHERKLRLQAD